MHPIPKLQLHLRRLESPSGRQLWYAMAQTFTYDAFGNLTKSGSITWNPGYNGATNRYALGGTTYDSNGNLLTDTFHTYHWNVETVQPMWTPSLLFMMPWQNC